MDDSIINLLLLSSSMHLKHVEELIKNLEQQTQNDDLSFKTCQTKPITSKSTSTNALFDDEFVWDDQYDKQDISLRSNTSHRSIDRIIRSIHSNTDPLSNMNDWSMSSKCDSLNDNIIPSLTTWDRIKPNQRIKLIDRSEESPLLNHHTIFQKKSNDFNHHTVDRAVQTSIQFDPLSNKINQEDKTKCFNHPKSMPDLSFVSKYSEEFPHSRSLSPLSSKTIAQTTVVDQKKNDTDRPRTLKSIKRYKNNKHSTEPLSIFYSPQLCKTFAAIPTSTINQLKSTNKYEFRTKSCDIQNLLHDQKRSILRFNKDPITPIPIRRCSEYDLKSIIEPTRTNYSVASSHPSTILNNNLVLKLNEQKERLKNRPMMHYNETARRCQTDIIIVDPVLRLFTLTDSPPNEFHLQANENDEIAIEKPYINIIPNLDDPVPLNDDDMTQTSMSMNSILFQNFLHNITDTVKRILEIKQLEKTFTLNNENNLQLDSLIKDELCKSLENILEHGRYDSKKITLWKIIETSIDENNSIELIPQVYYDAKKFAQIHSTIPFYKFQAFIFALLNKSELINWLYYFTRQKPFVQRYYRSPDALILVSTSTTFNIFERIMTQLEKLTTITFQLTYSEPTILQNNDNEQLSMSIISGHSIKSTAREWVMTISRRNSSKSTQSAVPTCQSNNTLRATLSKRFNSFFNKTTSPEERKPFSIVTTKLPKFKQTQKSPELLSQTRLSDIFSRPLATLSTNKLNIDSNTKLADDILQFNKTSNLSSIETKLPFESNLIRPSLNVDKPKSARYRSALLVTK